MNQGTLGESLSQFNAEAEQTEVHASQRAANEVIGHL